MMNKNLPDERLVYLALKDSFKGADAQIRKAKKVRELVQKAQYHRVLNGQLQRQKLQD
jgi:hypothetical protein